MEWQFVRMTISKDFYQEGETMEKKRVQFFLIAGAAVIALLFGFFGPKKEKEETKIQIEQEQQEEQQEEKSDSEIPKASEEETWMTKSQIKQLENQSDDNLDLTEHETEAELKFSGYYENPQQFSWLGEEEWADFQNALKNYLQRKGLTDVTEVNLHPDSIQALNDYERYIYMDVDHKTDYTDRLIIQADCDTYMDTMRFAFEIQYGN